MDQKKIRVRVSCVAVRKLSVPKRFGRALAVIPYNTREIHTEFHIVMALEPTQVILILLELTKSWIAIVQRR